MLGAIALASNLTLLYVGNIYICSHLANPACFLDRELRSVKNARLFAIGLNGLVIPLLSSLLLPSNPGELLLLETEKTRHAIKYTLVLLAPLIAVNILQSHWQPKFSIASPKSILLSKTASTACLQYLIGPFVEELVFRKCFIDLLGVLGGCSDFSTTVLSSLLFSIAHVHGLLFAMVFPQAALDGPDIITSGIQAAFTFVFGLYASHIYGRTGSVLTCALTHSLCNWVGFPVWELLHVSFRRLAIVSVVFVVAILYLL